MDHDRFDSLSRIVFTGLPRSRRAALVSAIGATLLWSDRDVVAARKTRKKKVKGDPRPNTSANGVATTAAADACYPNTNCAPGRGKNVSGCDFAHATVFRNADLRGANVSNANFFAADLTGADFRGANLSGGCFVGADLTGARLGPSVNLHHAVFCNTTMPDGSLDNSGCEGETACCHLREQDCPDASFNCIIVGRDGECGATVGRLNTGTCWSFPLCCPCQHHDDQAYWNALCEQTFTECAGRCQAEFEGANGCHEGFICP